MSAGVERAHGGGRLPSTPAGGIVDGDAPSDARAMRSNEREGENAR
jgi:hypothetical protein